MCQKYSSLLSFPRAYFFQMCEMGGGEDRDKEYDSEAAEYAHSPQAGKCLKMLLCLCIGTHVSLAFTL
jgi:hypothetical protein